MRGTLVNLNVNPCKMCMPMGAATALYGIKKCMSILHGSQGCSTYIRRHMATHYNEPVDIASSSLTEEGTVYGGEKNLLQGLLNLIKVYDPEVIGVATTCLAETIGEDIHRIIGNFYEKYPEYKQVTIIPIASAGYSGTHYEGFMETLYQIVKAVPMDTAKNNKVNIVTGQLSPADTRYLKGILEGFAIDYILLPDLSENLDGIYQPEYQKLPVGGTDIREIGKMAGARMTIELSAFAGEIKSVGRYLEETYGVPYQVLNLPIGLRDNDRLFKLLKVLSGREIPAAVLTERGRYLDAMVDSHKYYGEVRAAIYGEPDFVYSMVRLCTENGILPVIAATGSKCDRVKELIREELQGLSDSFDINETGVLDEVDFQTIEELARERRANLLIGNSDGRRIAEKLGIQLIRRSFPVHDHVGGQRLRTLGYEGSLTVLDEVANVMIDAKESSFRKELYDRYYTKLQSGSKERKTNNHPAGKQAKIKIITVAERFSQKNMEDRTQTHPCFNCKAHKHARMHLPIAPRCNISCNYCLRKYDCPNESRPGVTTGILKPQEALQRFLEVRKKVANLTVVGIAGPGDALANFQETKKTLKLIREQDQDITFCLSTNGLMLPHYAEELISLGVSHVTVTMNTINPSIGAKIYKYVDYMGVQYVGEAGAAILIANQMAGLKLLTSRGIVCKVNIVMLKGINDGHIPEVVKKVKELGAAMTNIMPLIPVKGSAFEQLEPVGDQELLKMRNTCGEILKQMYHCRQCRADAVGTLGQGESGEYPASISQAEAASAGISERFTIAVATKSGIVVDQHFGHVTEFYIYHYDNGNIIFKEKRAVEKYCGGRSECEEKEDRIGKLIHTIADCSAVIALRIGEAPREKLYGKGIQVFTDCDGIEASVRKVASKLAVKREIV